MAYGGRHDIVPYQNNGYGMAPIQSYPNKPQNTRKSGKHEDEEAGKLFVGGLRWEILNLVFSI